MTKIVAGSNTLIGKLMYYDFTQDKVVFRTMISERDIHSYAEFSVPLPNAAMITAIKKAGIKGLQDAEINFNRNIVRLKLGENSLMQTSTGVERPAIGGAFF